MVDQNVYNARYWKVIEVLHRYGVTITLAGLVGFSVFSKIKPLPKEDAQQ